MMKEAVVGGLVAGLMAGSIVAGAVVFVHNDTGTSVGSASQGPIRVFGEVTISNPNPISVKIDAPWFGFNPPDGSVDRPYHIVQAGALWVHTCDNRVSAASLPGGVIDFCKRLGGN